MKTTGARNEWNWGNPDIEPSASGGSTESFAAFVGKVEIVECSCEGTPETVERSLERNRQLLAMSTAVRDRRFVCHKTDVLNTAIGKCR
jgi:hypothetical protein